MYVSTDALANSSYNNPNDKFRKIGEARKTYSDSWLSTQKNRIRGGVQRR